MKQELISITSNIIFYVDVDVNCQCDKLCYIFPDPLYFISLEQEFEFKILVYILFLIVSCIDCEHLNNLENLLKMRIPWYT